MEISNEEKATEIALSNDIYDTTEVYQSDVVDMLMEMAQWKDEQSAQEKQQLIDKAAEWLRMTMDFFNNGEFNTEKFVNDFKKETSSFDEEQYMRLWTIEDAKDGDVLVIESGRRNNECLFIFKDIACREVLEHCYYRTNDSTFSPTGSFIGYLDNIYHPATKEQCILLFSKMKEAGYEWDFDKKELRKIDDYCKENCKGFQETGKCFADGECKAKRDAEQKPADETPYSETLDKAIDLYYYTYGNGNDGFDNLSLDKFRDIVHTFIEDYGQKSTEWSDEDEEMKRAIISNLFILKQMYTQPVKQTDYNYMIEWLKSLKPHWKPTKEQMNALSMAYKDSLTSGENLITQTETLKSLYNNLKKL